MLRQVGELNVTLDTTVGDISSLPNMVEQFTNFNIHSFRFRYAAKVAAGHDQISAPTYPSTPKAQDIDHDHVPEIATSNDLTTFPINPDLNP